MKVTDAEYISIFNVSRSIREINVRLGLKPDGANFGTQKRRIARLGLDQSLLKGKGWSGGSKRTSEHKASLDRVLANEQPCSSWKLKNRLVAAGLLVLQCSRCGIVDWLGEQLALELDHVDGNRDNNDISNLRILCPNCHAQTPTYRARIRQR